MKKKAGNWEARHIERAIAEPNKWLENASHLIRTVLSTHRHLCCVWRHLLWSRWTLPDTALRRSEDILFANPAWTMLLSHAQTRTSNAFPPALLR